MQVKRNLNEAITDLNEKKDQKVKKGENKKILERGFSKDLEEQKRLLDKIKTENATSTQEYMEIKEESEIKKSEFFELKEFCEEKKRQISKDLEFVEKEEQSLLEDEYTNNL